MKPFLAALVLVLPALLSVRAEVLLIEDWEAGSDGDSVTNAPYSWTPNGGANATVSSSTPFTTLAFDGAMKIDNLFVGRGDLGLAFTEIAHGTETVLAFQSVSGGVYQLQFSADPETDGKLFVNRGNGNHWLKVRLAGDGTSVNRCAIGAQARIEIDGKTLTRQVESTTGERNQSDLVLHFGLGSHTDPVDVQVFWPDGTLGVVSSVDVDQTVSIGK